MGHVLMLQNIIEIRHFASYLNINNRLKKKINGTFKSIDKNQKRLLGHNDKQQIKMIIVP